MNKIFKHKRGASGLKVVCEFAKSHCSSGEKTAVNSGAHVSIRSGFKSLSIALISALTLGIATPAMAVNGTGGGSQSEYAYIRGSQATGTNALAIGKDAKAVGYEKNTAYGSDAEASGGGWNLAIGSNAHAIANGYLNRGNAIAIGSDTQATGQRAMAIGANAEATQGQGVAIGSGTKSIGAQSTAIGNDVVATGMSAIAIGNDDIWNGGATDSNNKLLGYERQVFTDEELKDPKIVEALDAMCRKEDCPNSFGLRKVGNHYEKTGVNFMHWSPTLSAGLGSIVIGSRSVAVGKGSTAIGTLTVATGDESTAIGTLSKATVSKAIAIGRDSIANMENSVALGVSSKTDYTGMNTKAYVPSLGYVMPMANSVGVISVGSSNQQRRIVNLAPGALDTDAVNVSQLKSLAESLGMDGINDSADKMMRYLSVEKATGEAATLQASLAKEKAFKTYAELRKIRDMMALNENATGGTYDQSEKDKINKQITDLQNKYDGFETGISNPATAAEISSISTSSSEAAVKALTNKINAYTDTNPFALNSDQKEALKQKNATNEGATGADAIAIGYDAKSTGAQAVSLGKTATASGTDAIAIGNGAKADGGSSINIGSGVKASLGGNVTLIGNNNVAGEKSSVSLSNTSIIGSGNKIDGGTIDHNLIIGTRHEINQDNDSKGTKLSQNVIIGDHINFKNSEEVISIGSDTDVINSQGGITIGGDSNVLGGYERTGIKGKGAIAIGAGAQVGENFNQNTGGFAEAGVSLGVKSKTTVAQGVALGSESVADRVSIVNKTDAYNGSDEKVAGTIKGNYGAVSVGNSNATRQIINVAAGSEDTDAVNVAQLKNNGFNVKVKDGTSSAIKSGKTVEFASADKYLKISHTADNGNSKFTFDVDENELKKTIGATSGGNYSLGFIDDAGTQITRDQTNKELKIKGGAAATNLSTNNIGVEASGDTLNIKLAKALTGLTSAEFKNTAGDTTVINGDGIKYNPKDNTDTKQTVSLGKDGINAGSKIISNVATGVNEGDAVNKKQAETIAQNAAKDFAKDKLIAGANVTISTPNADGGVTISATDKDTKTVVTGGSNVTVSSNTIDDTTTYTVGLDTATMNKINNAANATNAMQSLNVKVGAKNAELNKDNSTLEFAAGKNLTVELNPTDRKVTYSLADDIKFNNIKTDTINAGKDGSDGTPGKNGTVTVSGSGNADEKGKVVINGQDGSIGLTGKDGTNGLTIRGDKGAAGLNGTDGITRIVYTDKGNNKHEVATLDDGLKFGGNDGETSKKLNTKFDIKGLSTNTTWADFDQGKNIMTQVDSNGVMTIALAKALTGLTSAEFSDRVKIGGATISKGTDNSLSFGGAKITNIADGSADGDAVNKKQMDEAINKAVAASNSNTTALTFVGDNGNTKAKDGKINIIGGQTDTSKLSDKPNIGVVAKDGKLDIKLAKDIVVDSVTAKNSITVGEGANKITIADGKISGITSAVDPKGELADKLAEIDKSSKTDTDKAKDKKDAIQKALENVSNGNVATVGDLKNVTNGLDSVVTNITNNVSNITSNVTNITNITSMVANQGDKQNIDKAAEASKKYQSATTDEEKQKIAEEAKEVVKNNKIKTYNPYETTVKNNTTIVEAIQNMNERGIKFIHVSAENNLGKDDNFAFDSEDSRANQKGSIGIGMKATSTAENAIATGTESTASGLNAIATGTKSEASGKNSIAMGTGAQAMGENTISIGTGNKVIGINSGAIGDPTYMTNTDGVYSIGNNNIIEGDNITNAKDVFVLGNDVGSKAAPITEAANYSVILGSKGYSSVKDGVALGSNSVADRTSIVNDKASAYNGSDEKVANTIQGDYGAVSVGNSKATRQIINVAAGRDDSDAVNVAQLRAATAQIMASTNGISMNGVTIDPNTGKQVNIDKGNISKYMPEAKNINSVAIGANSVANRANTVSVGSAGNERIIANVADGVAPTDAANMRQLQSVANMVGEVKKDAMAGTASAMAIGNLPQATIPGKGMMAIGAGYYKGQTATALGVSKMSENGKWVFKASASYDSQRNVGAAGAVGFHF